jgi:coenzyme F420 hydrogenase subunit beta
VCEKVCPAIASRRDELMPEGRLPEAVDGPLGLVADVLVARRRVLLHDHYASSGALTGMLEALMQAGEIDAVVGVGMDPENPARAKTKIARSMEDIDALAGSCYQIVDQAAILPKLRKLAAKPVFIGVPCQLQALRRYQRLVPKCHVELAVGIFCGFNLLPEATDFLVGKLRRGSERPERIEYRGGPWPGGFRVHWDSGRQSFLTKNAYSLVNALYQPDFCRYCVDLAGEVSDVSIGDAWYRPGGWSTVLVRSERGRQAIRRAVELGFLEVEPASIDDVIKSQAHLLIHKKTFNAARILARPDESRPDFQGYQTERVSPSQGVLAFRWALAAARGLFRFLPLGVFTAASRFSRWLSISVARRKPR